MFRLLTSWRVLVPVLVAVLGGLVVLAGNLEDQQRTRTISQVVTDADLADQLLVGVELPADGGTPSAFAPASVARMDRGVRRLEAAGRLVGLTVWTAQGRLVYSDADESDQLEPDELADVPDVLAGHPRVTFEQDSWRPQATATVLIRTGNGLVSEVFLPQDAIADRLATASRRFYTGTGVVVALVTGMALLGRRRLLRREHQALHDPLTGLGNRTLLRREADRLLADRRSSRRPGGVTALLLIDLDGFKLVNDTFGHDAGDRLLIGVGAALREGARRGDVVTRLGGDEFALLLPGLRDAADAARAAEHVAEQARRPVQVDGRPVQVGASVGVALAPGCGEDLSTMLRRADVAMYRAKRAGGGVQFHDPDEDDGVRPAAAAHGVPTA